MSLVPAEKSLRPRSHELALQRAKSLSRSVLSGIQDAEKAVIADAENRKAADMGEREATIVKLKAKAAECMEVTKSSEECLVHVAEMLRQLGQCLRRLQHARYAQFGELKVCEQRIRMRSAGPPEELVKDRAQRALREQYNCISNARDELLGLEKEVKRAQSMIENLRDELAKDASSQRHASHQLQSTIVIIQQALTFEAAESKDSAEKDNFEVLERTAALLAAAARLAGRCGEAVQRTSEECSVTRVRAEELLVQRTHQSESAAKKLRQQATEVDYTITVAERSLSKTSKRLAGRPKVSKEAKLDRTKSMLQELRGTRKQLQEEIQRKLAMLSIDESCRKVTAQAAAAEDIANAGGSRLIGSRPATASGISGMRRSASDAALTDARPGVLALDVHLEPAKHLPSPVLSLSYAPSQTADSVASTAASRPKSAVGYRAK